MELDWEAIRKDVRSRTAGPAGWPAGVKPITMDGLSLIGIDERNRLYWDGKRIATALKLNRLELLLLSVAAIGALLSGLSDALGYLKIDLF